MDLEDILLMMPGPVPVAPRVLRAMSKPTITNSSRQTLPNPKLRRVRTFQAE